MRSLTRREEHFTPSLNDKGVKQLEEYFEELFEMRNDVVSGYGRCSNKNYTGYAKKLVEKIETCVRKRFGFNIELRFSNTPLAVRIIDPKNSSGLRDTTELVKEAKKVLSHGYSADSPVEIRKLLDDIDKLDASLHREALKINMDALYIDGLPPEFRPTLFMNITELTKPELYITPREVLAGFLHELGHVFTYLVFSYRLRNKKLMLERSVKAWYKKGKKDKEAFLLGYQEVFKGVKSDRSEVKELDMFKDIANDINEQLYFTDKKDKEFIADAFVACFGYAGDMISLVGKLGGYQTYNMMVSDLQVLVCSVGMLYVSIYFCVGIFFSALGMASVAAWSIVIQYMLWVIVILGVLLFVQALLLRSDPTFKEYGDVLNRCERQRRNCIVLINKVQEDGGDREVIDMLLQQVEFIEREIDYIKEIDRKNVVASFCNWLMSWNTKFLKTKEFSEFKETLEDLLHNDLALSKAKLMSLS